MDIGAIEFIHKRLIAMRDAGKAVLLVSVELDEIMSLSDRILVMFDGTITGELDGVEADERQIGLLMAGITKRLRRRELYLLPDLPCERLLGRLPDPAFPLCLTRHKGSRSRPYMGAGRHVGVLTPMWLAAAFGLV